ncbi:ABC transporter ATP-binding protein [Psychroflexus sp. ALD_RP9]|uniref:ABC transporter ATP-binding protein n=1 Tax=Psychroflexus sp. ALD_RP9 TaxID=2777186 RepID=UPI001A90BA74|nr:ABC transporter ATP-binding protein [Psychroflexus sp. ALD_RP9]QSS96383.1 ABC transporter ATP-binding protein [Psychroflexus sp. ALD_RP9]
MNKTILTARNISKQYRLGLVGTGTLGHDLNRWWHCVRGKDDPYLKIGAENDRSKKAESDYVWALRDINFDVKEGEVLGIIGKNGAGKSTLLKILSRVTMPTTGSIKTKGRIASLLEVGTGFHPELTGRENIYLNGAILGMTKSEIKAKEEEIIDFSGCAMYVDTPVKRYSSGMRVRLAFAVAAHLEPDILVVDEVLAVGDAEFQKKAIGKMKDISGTGGRTVLFVSHNMAAVKSLCTRGVVLEHGTSVFEGTADECVDYYLKSGEELTNFKNLDLQENDFRIESVGIKNQNSSFDDPILEDQPILFELKYSNKSDVDYRVTLKFKDSSGNDFMTVSNLNKDNLGLIEGNKLVLEIPNGFFNAKAFYVDMLVFNFKGGLRSRSFTLNDILSFNIVYGKREEGAWLGESKALIKPNFNWKKL